MKIELNKSMKWLLGLEELLLFIGSVILFGMATSYSWWLFALLFFLPDVSFIGYTINPKIGAYFYNLLHHRGLMVLLILAGYFAEWPLMLAVGIVFLGHASFDRMFGYGLKFTDSFHHTHLGYLNQNKRAES